MLEVDDIPGSDPSSWSGRTRLEATREELREALFRSLDAEETWFGAAQLLKSLDEDTGRPSPVMDDFSFTDDAKIAGLRGFSGWHRRSPPHPNSTPPLPLDLRLPADSSLPPLEVLDPWWRELVAGAQEAEPMTWLFATTFEFRPWEQERGYWGHDDLAHLCTSSVLVVYPDAVEMTGTLTESDPKVNGPGRISGLVPIYGEVKSLLSTATRQTQNLVIGCRLRPEWIRAINFSQRFLAKPHKLTGRRVRELSIERGYGQLKSTEIAIEVDDGWRPSLVSISAGYVPPDQEDHPKELAKWLVTMIADQRLAQPGLSSAERQIVSEMATAGPELSEERNSGDYVRYFRYEIAGSQPIAVPLAD